MLLGTRIFITSIIIFQLQSHPLSIVYFFYIYIEDIIHCYLIQHFSHSQHWMMTTNIQLGCQYENSFIINFKTSTWLIRMHKGSKVHGECNRNRVSPNCWLISNKICDKDKTNSPLLGGKIVKQAPFRTTRAKKYLFEAFILIHFDHFGYWPRAHQNWKGNQTSGQQYNKENTGKQQNTEMSRRL